MLLDGHIVVGKVLPLVVPAVVGTCRNAVLVGIGLLVGIVRDAVAMGVGLCNPVSEAGCESESLERSDVGIEGSAKVDTPVVRISLDRKSTRLNSSHS